MYNLDVIDNGSVATYHGSALAAHGDYLTRRCVCHLCEDLPIAGSELYNLLHAGRVIVSHVRRQSITLKTPAPVKPARRRRERPVYSDQPVLVRYHGSLTDHHGTWWARECDDYYATCDHDETHLRLHNDEGRLHVRATSVTPLDG